MDYFADYDPSLNTQKNRFYFFYNYLQRIKDKVSQIYYKHGLLCSSRPWIVIIISLSIFIFSCYPTLGNHFSRRSYSHKHVTNILNFWDPLNLSLPSSSPSSPSFFPSLKDPPKWLINDKPHAIIQQILIKSAVLPWKNNMILMDAIRAPLGKVFSLVQYITNYSAQKGDKSCSLNDICYQVGESLGNSQLLPRYSCFLLSPANIWSNDIHSFQSDPTILKSIFNVKDFGFLGSGTIREILFGVQWMETGIRPFYVTSRSRTITYGITLILNKWDNYFLKSLVEGLKERYGRDNVVWSEEYENKDKYLDSDKFLNSRMVHLHFPDKWSMREYSPLVATYIMLFFYIYFSVRKIDLVKCKWLLACGSVLTVIMSLIMAVGICSWFDFNPTLNGSEILPYLIVIIGLENTLVLTKSVVFTPTHLDIKVRVAQGLSREGWSISKNLISELILLLFGYVTMVPVIQEFCLFSGICLVSDFFLQLTIFTTFLSVDIQRVQTSESKKLIKRSVKNATVFPRQSLINSKPSKQVFSSSSQPIPFKLPKRLRFVYFWARTRMVHRFLMICLVTWILLLLYKSGIVDQLAHDGKFRGENEQQLTVDFKEDDLKSGKIWNESLMKLKHVHESRYKLPDHYWYNLFGYYNISLMGKYISFLPPVLLSIPVDSTEAFNSRHPSETDSTLFRGILRGNDAHNESDDEIPRSWTSREITLGLFCSIPLLGMIYALIILYRCICPKRYDKWRSSWWVNSLNKREGIFDPDVIVKLITAHKGEIEYLSGRGILVATACLEGNIRIWDADKKECKVLIKRRSQTIVQENIRSQAIGLKALDNPIDRIKTEDYFCYKRNQKKVQNFTSKLEHKTTGSFSSDSTYGSSPGSGEWKELTHKGENETNNVNNNEKYDFSPYYSRMVTSSNVLDGIITSALDDDESISERNCEKAEIVLDSIDKECNVWALEVFDKWICVGYNTGVWEVRNALNGSILYKGSGNGGVTCMKLAAGRLIIGRLNGILEFFTWKLEDKVLDNRILDDEITLRLQNRIKGSGAPINLIRLGEDLVVTGSGDGLIKVYEKDANCIYTLHGHFGGITCVEIDKYTWDSALSGCKVGQVCFWDLLTGTCLFNLQAHKEAPVTSLLITPLYAISSGADHRIHIWDKYSGNLFHTIYNIHSLSSSIVALQCNVLIISKDDRLVLWDISESKEIKVIRLDTGEKSYIKSLLLINSSVVCDYGRYLCFIHLPGLDKND